jgi:hypothetical protein
LFHHTKIQTSEYAPKYWLHLVFLTIFGCLQTECADILSYFMNSNKTYEEINLSVIKSQSSFEYAYVFLQQFRNPRRSAGTGPVNRYRTGPDRFRRSTGPEKTGNSPVEILKKYVHFVVFFCQKMFYEYCYQVNEILYYWRKLYKIFQNCRHCISLCSIE